jgi:hypothetical protein
MLRSDLYDSYFINNLLYFFFRSFHEHSHTNIPDSFLALYYRSNAQRNATLLMEISFTQQRRSVDLKTVMFQCPLLTTDNSP